MSAAVSPDLLEQLSQVIASHMGLSFPRERWGDLADTLASQAQELGLEDPDAYAARLLSSPLTRREIDVLSGHFTVGETYFFREKSSFDILERQILPELIGLRRRGDRRLRVWSAGCCTGEEPYSVAMLIDRMIPDLSNWNVSILATDINSRFLEMASAGTYREWSFRAVPPGIRDRYFSPLPDGTMQIAPRIREMVTFAFLNLAENEFPSLGNQTNAMDVVLCRNVLMYFTPENAARVVGGFHGALVDNGWLLVAPVETSQELFQQYTVVPFPEAIIYRKADRKASSLPVVERSAVDDPSQPNRRREPPSGAEREAEKRLVPPESTQAESPILVARDLANRGRLAEALSWCDVAVSADPLNPAYRFLRAMVAQELGMLEEAVRSLEHALYLDQGFVMAYYELGNVARRLGRHALSRRHFRGALGLLEGLEPDAPLPESSGLTASRLTEIIRSMSVEAPAVP